MKILYFDNFNKNPNQFTTGIKNALLQLKHDVEFVDTDDFEMGTLIKKANESDVFFFTDGGIVTENPLNYHLTLERLKKILTEVKSQRVFWFPHRIWQFSEDWIQILAPWIDFGFLVDETWIRRHNYENMFPLHPGFDDSNYYSGKKNSTLESDVAFVGRIYGPRGKAAETLKSTFRDSARIYGNIWGRDFADLCKSAKIILSFKSPFNEFYWSDRIYNTLGQEGFMLHHRAEGLRGEFEEGGHYIGYGSWDEMVDAINYWSKPENDKAREQIAKQGRQKVLQEFTYKHRLEQIFQLL